ncbi:MAG: AmmeMemoRadiSam system protein B, partial [Nitrospinota bacterium]
MEFKDQKPVMRPVDTFPVEHEGEKLILLRDPQSFSENSLTITLAAYMIIVNMNGHNTVEEILNEFNKTYKASLKLKEMRQLVDSLDNAYLLQNENFQKHMKKTVKEFADMPVRKSSLAGRSYPENPDELSKQLDGYLNGKSNGKGKSPFAIVAPHIDLNAGGETFGAAFSQIKDSKAETFVILGIGHTLAEDFFACVKKDFETPIGTSPVDAEFLKNLEKDFGEPIYENQFAHRSEHSAEFQVLFLQKLFGGENPPRKIVPILLSFPENIDELDHPVFNKERVDKFIAALSKGIERLGDKVCVIAGIDMSHIGRRFGHKDGAPEKRRL